MKNQIKNQIVWMIPIITIFCSIFYIGIAVKRNTDLLKENISHTEVTLKLSPQK